MTTLTDFKQTVTIENCVLGAILINGNAIDFVYEDLMPECFVMKENMDVYFAMQTLKKSNTPINLITVANELRKQGTYEQIGASYLANLTNNVVTSANIEYHARILLQRYVDREIDSIGRKKSKDPIENFLEAKKKIEGLENKIGKKTNTKHVSNALNKALTEMNERIKNVQTGQCVGISSGIRELDKVLNGWQPARLYVIAARPGMGKTTITLQFAREAVMKGKSVLFFSLEMSEIELSNKLLLSMSSVTKSRFDSGYLNKEESDEIAHSARKIASYNFFIDDTAGISMSGIKAKAKEYKEMGQCDMVIIDYLQLCEEKGLKGRTREQEVSAMSRDAKIIAKELNIPVLLLSQLSRKVEERKDSEPQLADLRDCLPIDEWVDTPTGVVQLKTMPKEIIGVNNNGSKITKCEFIPKKQNNTYTIKTPFGSFRATSKHKILTGTGYKMVKDIDVNRDVLCSPNKIPHANKGYVHNGRLLGWLIGNGCLKGTPSLTLRNEFIKDLEELIKPFNVKINKRKTQKGKGVTEFYLSNGVESGSVCNPLMKWIRELGIENKKSYEKFIPNCYLGTDDKTHIELLQGLWETDGTVTRGVAKFSTTSELLARQVKWLLHTIGVHSSIQLDKKTEKRHQLFSVCCSVKDNERIKLICDNETRFGKLKNANKNYIDPCPAIFAELAKEYTTCEETGIRIHKKSNGNYKHISKKRLLKILEKTPIPTITESPFIRLENVCWTKIQSITNNYQDVKICDLYVQETHNFITNSILVSNSGAIEQDADIVMFIYRPNYYRIETVNGINTQNYGEFLIEKNRHGKIGKIKFQHNDEFTQFYDYGTI